MRCALRNQEKIAAAYGTDYLQQHIIMPIPEIEFEEVEELSDSERGTGGYGSSGL